MSDLLRFVHLAGRLKETPRAGWELRGIAHPESVADHTFRLGLLALVLAGRAAPPLDRERCVALAVVHDLGESLVGDITPYDGVSAEEKSRRERGALAELAALLGDDEVLRLWEEYEGAASAEARFVKELDKLETAFQATEYEAREGLAPGELEEFLEGCERRLTFPVLRDLFAALVGGRRSGPPPER